MLHVISVIARSPPPCRMMPARRMLYCLPCPLAQEFARKRLNSESTKHVVPILREASARSPSVILGVSDRQLARLSLLLSRYGETAQAEEESGSVGRPICSTNETVCGGTRSRRELERPEPSGGASECSFNTSQNRIPALWLPCRDSASLTSSTPNHLANVFAITLEASLAR